ncbi:enoyl-CoA hydratase-related protein [Acinetobacter puyangensis]|uniref:enoyl-CoA hydratase-related protein n=1 Tax=Acinetobacter puyangensis TaxID=1096779 RepID=UPI003A4DCB9D
MIYQGNTVSVSIIKESIANFCFNLKNQSINKFNRETLIECKAALQAIKLYPDIKGIIVTSAKSVFIVGADITEFTDLFEQSEADIRSWAENANDFFNAFEDLNLPKVAAINGFALGGGFEMCLTCDYRVMAESAQIGLPELSLGLIPGFGGTVRLCRIIGVEKTIQWIQGIVSKNAKQALMDGAIDAVVHHKDLIPTSIQFIEAAIAGELSWQSRYQEKIKPIHLTKTAKNKIFIQAYREIQEKDNDSPAYHHMLEAIRAGIVLERDAAIREESKHFAFLGKTAQAKALIQNFLDKQLKKKQLKSE